MHTNLQGHGDRDLGVVVLWGGGGSWCGLGVVGSGDLGSGEGSRGGRSRQWSRGGMGPAFLKM